MLSEALPGSWGEVWGCRMGCRWHPFQKHRKMQTIADVEKMKLISFGQVSLLFGKGHAKGQLACKNEFV